MTVMVENPVGDLLASLAQLPSGHPSTWDLDELRNGIPDLLALRNQVDSLTLEAVASYDTRGGAQIDGHRTMGDWLEKTTRISNAGATVHTARDLRDNLPATAEALHSGAISTEHVRAIRRAFRIFGDQFAAVEATVVDYARAHTAKELRALVDLMIQQYGPDGSDAEAKREKRKLFLSQSLDGWWYLDGLLDPATGEKLKTALDVYGQEAGEDDRRTAPMRRVDALVEIAERAMADTTDRPTGYGHLTVMLTAEELQTGLGVRWPSGALASKVDADLFSCSASVSYVVGLPTDDPVRWQPLAVGFAQRYATKGQRAALAVRDGSGCAHPGCTVPGWRCVAHHIRPWDQGGPTNLENLVLLCRFHHRRVHLGRLRVVWVDGRATTAAAVNRAPPLPVPS